MCSLPLGTVASPNTRQRDAVPACAHRSRSARLDRMMTSRPRRPSWWASSCSHHSDAVSSHSRSCKGSRVLDHLSIQCADVAASAAFYDAMLAPLGGTRVMDFGVVIG